MAYSRSIETLLKVRPSLTKLEAGEECEWVVERGQELAFAQRIREALFVASENSGLFPALASAYENFSIKRDRLRAGIVMAVRKKAVRLPVPSGTSFIDSLPTLAREALSSTPSASIQNPGIYNLENTDADTLMKLYQDLATKNLMFFLLPDQTVRVVTYNAEEAVLAWDPSDLS